MMEACGLASWKDFTFMQVGAYALAIDAQPTSTTWFDMQGQGTDYKLSHKALTQYFALNSLSDAHGI